MNEISEPAKAISQNDFLLLSSFIASAKLGASAVCLAWAAARAFRGSFRVRAAMMARTMPGAPATKKATRQPWASATRPEGHAGQRAERNAHGVEGQRRGALFLGRVVGDQTVRRRAAAGLANTDADAG